MTDHRDVNYTVKIGENGHVAGFGVGIESMTSPRIIEAAVEAARLEILAAAKTDLFEQKLAEMKKHTAEMTLAKEAEAERLERQNKWQKLLDVMIAAGATSQEAGAVVETLVTGGVSPEHAQSLILNGIAESARKVKAEKKKAEDAIPKPESYGSWA